MTSTIDSPSRHGGRSPSTGEWLHDWDPENEETWDRRLAWQTLAVSTGTLTLAFASWFIASAIAPKLNDIGFVLSKDQLYWLVAIPGLSAGVLRLVWMVLPPILGTRRLVTLTTLLLAIPLVGWGIAVQNPDTSYAWLLTLAALSGIGGGAFSGFMPSTSYFFPRRLQGTALGLQAGLGNFGVSLVQFVTPWIIGFSMVGFLGAAQTASAPGKPTHDVWYQNAAFVYVPFVIVGAVLAWTLLKSVPVRANIREQFDIFSNPDTWCMTLLYVMTFGTFAGLAGQFGLLLKNLYGAGNAEIVATLPDGSTQLLVAGYDVPDPVKLVFLGPLVGAAARVLFAPLTDRFGGARWTLVSGIGILASILYTMTTLTPDPAAGAAALDADFHHFLYGMMAIFLFAGIGNAATFKQMPMIFERRQAGGVIGWTGGIAAFGPFFFGVGLTMMSPAAFYAIGAAFAVLCIVITWVRYARPGAPMPS
ncbi:NarK/NasA family nitrate transporter [Nocardioides humilatus]|uniref:NarK/NasA family nitrate transporter n=1 Tax=Nocardioides humilatus TaxID=2607660 RepID=A0A5B1LAP4_9ACTN|nr:NarK/NasA family nitrate transporter [Nocardioides humilatus]